jgi:hypothetical protein
VVGTGGASHYALPSGTRPDNLVAAQAQAFGVLKLTLKTERYRWRWVSAAGQPAFADASGHAVDVCALPLDAGDGDALDEHTLGEEEEDDHGHHEQDGGGHGQVPLRLELSAELRQAHRQCP